MTETSTRLIATLIFAVASISPSLGASFEQTQPSGRLLSPPRTDATQAISWVVQDPASHVAIGGYDPVSYFDEGEPRLGDARWRVEYHGAVFLFATLDHLRTFQASPARYAPAFGGHDPEALGEGRFEPADPLNWTIVDGRLYLSRTPGEAAQFRSHKRQTVAAAAAHWSAVDRFYEAQFFRAHPPAPDRCGRVAGLRLNCVALETR